MKINLKSLGLATAMVLSATAIASAQGGSTDRNGNAVGSAGVSSTGAPAHGGGMERSTVGRASSGASSDSPNGSPSAPPTAKEGPAGDPSRDNDAPK
jgi:hypothetical protein